jgi:hypothetical protein
MNYEVKGEAKSKCGGKQAFRDVAFARPSLKFVNKRDMGVMHDGRLSKL